MASLKLAAPAPLAFQLPTPLPHAATLGLLRCLLPRPRRRPLACLQSAPGRRGSVSRLSRRAALQTLSFVTALPLLPNVARARRAPKEPLASSLVPLVRVRDALKDLSEDVSAGTNGDVRRVVKVVLAGSDVLGSARRSALWLDGTDAELAERHAREAFEYLNQVVDYFDVTQTKERPRSEVLRFCQMAIDAAGKELDEMLGMFDQSQVDQARTAVGGPVS